MPQAGIDPSKPMGVKRAVSPLFTAQGQQGMFMGPRGGGFQPPVCNVAPSSRFTKRPRETRSSVLHTSYLPGKGQSFFRTSERPLDIYFL
jgi:hypothetical protein